jgi:hypothetical protein
MESLEETFNQELLICDSDDQGKHIKAVCVFTGIEVEEPFCIGPIKLRPINDVIDKFPKDIRRDRQYSVLELNYIDREKAISMYAEPLIVQEVAFKILQLMVDNWSGISLIYHFDEDGNQISAPSGSTRFETADTEFPTPKGILEATEQNKSLFKKVLSAYCGGLQHAINRYSHACTEIKEESILDFVISLEGTLGYGLDTEISHRISVRGALVLGSDQTERKLYYYIFKSLYKIRSSIAHGNSVNIDKLSSFVRSITALKYYEEDWDKEEDIFKIRIIADIARQITRRVILKFVNDPKLLNEEALLKMELGM